MAKVTASQKGLSLLRELFKYDHKGKPILDEYGAFKMGVTAEEIDDYIRVRTNSVNVTRIRTKLYHELRGSTAPVVIVSGNEVGLIYRHDVQRYLDYVLEGKPTYFD